MKVRTVNRSRGDVMVSIIIPAYNCEAYIERCLISVCNQTYNDIEIIVIDDGSTDHTSDVCKRFCKTDKRIKLVHKKNGGLSSARNLGIELCVGEFITFIDSDDWVREDHIELLLRELKKNDADISITGYITVYDERKTHNKREFFPGTEVYEGDMVVRALFRMDKFQGMACSKMYRRELFDEIRFPVVRCYEDNLIMLQLFDKCEKAVWIPQYTYYYFQRPGSLVNSGYSSEKLMLMKGAAQWVRYSESRNNIFYMEAGAFYLKSILTLLINLNNGDKAPFSSDEKRLMRALRYAIRYIKGNPYIDKRKKILISAFYIGVPGKLIASAWRLWMSVKSVNAVGFSE